MALPPFLLVLLVLLVWALPAGAVPPGKESAPARVLRCGAGGEARTMCPAQGQVERVVLLRALDRGACREGRTWGYTRTGVWTRGGCQGEFRITYWRPAATVPAGARERGGAAVAARPARPAQRRVVCGAARGAQECDAGGPVARMRLLQDLSGQCARAGRFGYVDERLWTRGGCRGRFELTYRDKAAAPAVAAPSASASASAPSAARRAPAATPPPAAAVPAGRADPGTPRNAPGARASADGLRTWSLRPPLPGSRTELPDAGTLARSRIVACGNALGTPMRCPVFGRIGGIALLRELPAAPACDGGAGLLPGLQWPLGEAAPLFLAGAGAEAWLADACGARPEPTRCVRGRDWGDAGSAVWVGRCRAEFVVRYDERRRR